ncbi:SDR family NAD(P)-dependent oxidoreductase [bacterium]|nr:SDR family NAD(P)-dependent oxidoreductase [bacterium]
MENKKIVFISGASSGMGFETAKLLAQKGFIVYAGARTLEKMEPLKNYGINILYLDVTDDHSCQNAVNTVIEKEGKIDILINNAGFGLFGSVEDVTIEQAKNQFEVNLFGLARLTKEVLPSMREKLSGKIINISSMGGRFVSPFGAWYHSSKYAVEALSDALRMELSQFNIKVILIEPGIIKTNWDNIALNNLKEISKDGVYRDFADRMITKFKKLYTHKFATKPEKVSEVILKAINSENPKTRYLTGFLAKQLIFLHFILPDRILDKILTNF